MIDSLHVFMSTSIVDFAYSHTVWQIQIHRIYPTKTTPIFFPYFSFFFSPFLWDVNPQIYLSQKFSQSSLLAVSDADCPSLLLSPRPFSLSLKSKLKEKITVSRIKLKKKEKLCRLIISHQLSLNALSRVELSPSFVVAHYISPPPPSLPSLAGAGHFLHSASVCQTK